MAVKWGSPVLEINSHVSRGILPRMSEADTLALAAEYRGTRAQHRPPKCKGGPKCWVEVGAQADEGGGCKLCHQHPR